jgi:ABC-type sugar transport system substrate-binding protein
LPAELDSPAPNTSPEVALILPGAPELPLESSVWEQFLRLEAPRQGLIVSVDQPQPGDPSSHQADAIRDAVRRGVGAMIVVPGPGITEALVEARDQGPPVVLMDGTVTVPGKPLPAVVFQPVEVSAKALVSTALSAAKKAGFSESGPAFVMQNDLGDAHGEKRARALEEALKAANVTVLPRVKFKGYGEEAAKASAPVLARHRDLAIVIANDDASVASIVNSRLTYPFGKRFVVVGYNNERKNFDLLKYGLSAGLVDRSVPRLVREALRIAQALKRGETVPERTVVETPLRPQTGEENAKMGPMPGSRRPDEGEELLIPPEKKPR